MWHYTDWSSLGQPMQMMQMREVLAYCEGNRIVVLAHLGRACKASRFEWPSDVKPPVSDFWSVHPRTPSGTGAHDMNVWYFQAADEEVLFRAT